MRNTRRVAGWTGKRTAAAFGCSPSHISRVESGSRPSRELVSFYEETFGSDGLLSSLFEVVVHAAEQERRRAGGRREEVPARELDSRDQLAAVPGDATAYVSQSLPSGVQKIPGEIFEASWTIRNVGTVPWVGRRLERQGPLVGPGLIASARYVEIPDALPREETTIRATLKAPTHDCTSIAYFKMVDAEGRLCFPDSHQLGLDVVVMVRRNVAGRQ
jgi:transcriptional regulator with XRE-family HTH domain